MRVALVHRDFSFDRSLSRDTVHLARSLVGMGHDVHFYANPGTRTVDAPGITFHDVRPLTRSNGSLGWALERGSFALEATRALGQAWAEYDIVHVAGIGAWAHDVVTVHGVARANNRRWPMEEGRDFRFPRLRAAVRRLRPQNVVTRKIQALQFRPGRFRVLIAVSEQVRDDLQESHGVPTDLIEVIPCPIDLPRFTSPKGDGVRASLGIGAGDAVLLFVGHVFQRKGLPLAIEALTGIEPQPHLIVVGSDDRAPFVRTAERLGVADRVHFVGSTEHPERYYQDADVLVLPAKRERWGIPLVEAMAAGLPVVTSAVAGASSIVREARAGVVLADLSAQSVRSAVHALLRDPDTRRKMAARGRMAARRFDVDERARRVVAVYERASEGRKTRA
jgi:UDP-glucose:(heptosyl)LPS alpha-1,3-glucosyltransferase